LPFFIIPECNICLYHILCYLLKYPDITKINYEKAIEMLGTENEKTIRKHIKECGESIKKAGVKVAEILALMSCELPPLPVGASHLDILKYYINEAAKEKVRQHGGVKKPIAEILVIHFVYIFCKFRKKIKAISLENILHRLLFHDTS